MDFCLLVAFCCSAADNGGKINLIDPPVAFRSVSSTFRAIISRLEQRFAKNLLEMAQTLAKIDIQEHFLSFLLPLEHGLAIFDKKSLNLLELA